VIKVVKRGAALLSAFSWFSWYFLWKYFDAHEPNIPEPSVGRIYRLETHGSIVYLTLGEHYALYGLVALAAAFLLLVIVSHLVETKRLNFERLAGSKKGGVP
jgi:hypothetical protein